MKEWRHGGVAVEDVSRDAVQVRPAVPSESDGLQAREDRYRLLAENASDIVTLVTPDGTLEWISPSVSRILGWSPDELMGTHPWQLIHPEDVDGAAQGFAEASIPNVPPPPVILRFLRKDGGYEWLAATAHRTENGQFVVSYRRVEDQVRAQRALTEAEQRYRLLAENAHDLVLALDMKAYITWVSPSALSLLGYEPDELLGAFGAGVIHPDDLATLLEAAAEAREGMPASCRIRMRTKGGSDRWVQATPRVLRDAEGALVGGVIGVRDVHDEVLAREQLQHEKDFDGLTGLARRQIALERIQDILETRSAPGWALICVGVGGMTAVNQAYTYAAGDVVLRAVASRLVEAAGAHDRVARIAGDEFAVLMRDIVTPTDAANAAERLLASVRCVVPFGGIHMNVTACAGIAFWDGQSADALLRDATAAMRQAASQGTNRWEFLDGNVGERTRESLRVQSALADGLERGRLQPWLMPIVSMADGRLVGHEALVRWVLADGKVLAPDAFLGVAEQTGLILQIDRAVLNQAVTLLAVLPSDQHVSVNVSAKTLSSEDLAEVVTAELARVGVAPDRLHLEVTETSLLRTTDAVRAAMRAIADLGVTWWVDDFGTGFSSISHLRDLPIGGLKLDKSFTADVTANDSQATRLAHGLAGLANGLGLTTVAEGVETVEQVQVLMEHGWQMGQGELFGLATPFGAPISAPVGE